MGLGGSLRPNKTRCCLFLWKTQQTIRQNPLESRKKSSSQSGLHGWIVILQRCHSSQKICRFKALYPSY